MAFCQESTLSRPLTPETTPVPLLSPGYVHTYWVSFLKFVFKSFINIFWTECDLFCKKIQKCILLVQEKPFINMTFFIQGDQVGIAPRMFKALVGRGHPEFSTNRQQDAQEFLLHFINMVEVMMMTLSLFCATYFCIHSFCLLFMLARGTVGQAWIPQKLSAS